MSTPAKLLLLKFFPKKICIWISDWMRFSLAKITTTTRSRRKLRVRMRKSLRTDNNLNQKVQTIKGLQ